MTLSCHQHSYTRTEAILNDATSRCIIVNTVATAIEDNLCAYAAFFGATSVAEVNDQPNLLWVISRIPTLPFTGILRPYPPTPNLVSTVSTTMAYFHQHQARASWIFNPTQAAPDLITHLRQYDLRETANLPAMALNLSTLQPVPLHPLTVMTVTEPAMLATWVRLYAESNGAPKWVRDELLTLFSATAYRAKQPLTLYLGWHDDQPIATAAIFRAADTVGVYEVATLPAFRQQGIASALTAHALIEARNE